MIRIQQEPFNVSHEYDALVGETGSIGAVVSFVGRVRDLADEQVCGLTLEHYPGMTESVLSELVDDAVTRWSLEGVSVIHRTGYLGRGEDIVLVMTASAHRHAAFESCAYIMDHLKTSAPFWKKEHTQENACWVAAKELDDKAVSRWRDK